MDQQLDSWQDEYLTSGQGCGVEGWVERWNSPCPSTARSAIVYEESTNSEGQFLLESPAYDLLARWSDLLARAISTPAEAVRMRMCKGGLVRRSGKNVFA